VCFSALLEKNRLLQLEFVMDFAVINHVFNIKISWWGMHPHPGSTTVCVNTFIEILVACIISVGVSRLSGLSIRVHHGMHAAVGVQSVRVVHRTGYGCLDCIRQYLYP